MLHHVLVAVDGRRVIGQFHGEAERTVVKNLVVFVTVGHHEITVLHEGRGAAAQGGPHLVAVEAVAMVEMVGRGYLHLSCLVGLPCRLEVLDALVVAKFHLIALLNLQVGGVLHPHVDAIGLLARALQRRTIEAVGGTVILPRNVVHPLGIHPSGDESLHLLGLPGGDGIACLATGTNGHVDEQFPVVGHLIGHLLSEGVAHDDIASLGDAHLAIHLIDIDFH